MFFPRSLSKSPPHRHARRVSLPTACHHTALSYAGEHVDIDPFDRLYAERALLAAFHAHIVVPGPRRRVH